jgi:drug/metabolite transporter (DMT)-like permease
MAVDLGVLLALLCAVASNVGFLYKHRGACAAPEVVWRRPIRSAINLYRSRWFTVGMLIAFVAWLLHVGAMSLAPLSLVQAVIAGGLVLLTVLAERVFGFQVGRRQWLGVGLMALGLVLLAVTLPSSHGPHSNYSLAGMIGFESGVLSLGTLLVLSPPRLGGRLHEHHGVLLGVSAGLIFGVSDVALKALAGTIGKVGLVGLVSPWLLVAIVGSVIAFYASAHGLQKGEAVPVITLTTAGANVSAIGGGIIVFNDPMATDPVGIVLQSLAFVLVIAAASLTPAPVRAVGSHA